MIRNPEVTSKIMSAVRSSGTQPELMLRRVLFARGMRYRVRSGLPGRPDVIFTRAKVAVFVDGDRWHGNGWKARGFAKPEDEFRHANGEWWRRKINANVERDQQVNQLLATQGWEVVRIWESDVRADVAACCCRVYDTVQARLKALVV